MITKRNFLAKNTGWAVAVPLILLLLVCVATAQQTANGTVPMLVNFSGTLADVNGKALPGIHGVTFSLYAESESGVALWTETQNVRADSRGHYTVMLDSTTSQGLPKELFLKPHSQCSLRYKLYGKSCNRYPSLAGGRKDHRPVADYKQHLFTRLIHLRRRSESPEPRSGRPDCPHPKSTRCEEVIRTLLYLNGLASGR